MQSISINSLFFLKLKYLLIIRAFIQNIYAPFINKRRLIDKHWTVSLVYIFQRDPISEFLSYQRKYLKPKDELNKDCVIPCVKILNICILQYKYNLQNVFIVVEPHGVFIYFFLSLNKQVYRDTFLRTMFRLSILGVFPCWMLGVFVKVNMAVRISYIVTIDAFHVLIIIYFRCKLLFLTFKNLLSLLCTAAKGTFIYF